MSDYDTMSAFPVPRDGSAGMLLRDWFAGMALNGLNPLHYKSFSDMAEDAYKIADKMLAKRKGA